MLISSNETTNYLSKNGQKNKVRQSGDGRGLISSKQGSSSKVEVIKSVPTYEECTGGPVAQQIKDLNDELRKLRRDLEEKEQLLAATRVSTTNTGTSDLPPKSWVDKVATGDANSVLPESFDVILENGSCFTIKVWYPWRPLMCSKCRVFGHKTCREETINTTTTSTGFQAAKNKVWVIKDSCQPGGPLGQEVGLVVPPSVDECKGSSPPVLSPVASLKSKSEVNIKCAEGHQSALVMAITDAGVEASSSTNVISPVQCSANKFSALLETEAMVEVEDIQLPTDAGLIQDIIPPISPPKKRGRVNKFSLMGVVETKVTLENLQSTVAQCFPTGWNFMHNYNGGPVARIILGWDSGKMSVSSIFQSDQLVVVDIELLESKKKFMVSIVYGYNKC
ncbi:hypothetical protein Vadar_007031 [Vaccinium darrowii]|uniref:Uncharacterized protein n=1 Tax=Vaccinium darrowii TaxID=229202 RepID=A0ACB7Z333_9ERIC|nr:hypothetical protein Vadar_007031 [Vaccinium darrowii]